MPKKRRQSYDMKVRKQREKRRRIAKSGLIAKLDPTLSATNDDSTHSLQSLKQQLENHDVKQCVDADENYTHTADLSLVNQNKEKMLEGLSDLEDNVPRAYPVFQFENRVSDVNPRINKDNEGETKRTNNKEAARRCMQNAERRALEQRNTTGRRRACLNPGSLARGSRSRTKAQNKNRKNFGGRETAQERNSQEKSNNHRNGPVKIRDRQTKATSQRKARTNAKNRTTEQSRNTKARAKSSKSEPVKLLLANIAHRISYYFKIIFKRR